MYVSNLLCSFLFFCSQEQENPKEGNTFFIQLDDVQAEAGETTGVQVHFAPKPIAGAKKGRCMHVCMWRTQSGSSVNRAIGHDRALACADQASERK